MGIRFHCNHCQKRLNVKAKQAGEFCICPDCESEIQIPLESTIQLKKKRKKKRRRKSTVEVDVSPLADGTVADPNLNEPDSSNPIYQADVPAAADVSAVVSYAEVSNSVEEETVTVETVTPDSELALAPPAEPRLSQSDTFPAPPAELERELFEEDSASESATFGNKEENDSAAVFDQMMGSSCDLETESSSEETESFLLAKPVVKIENDPFKGDPDLVWYLRHKRLGEKGPLKAGQVEAMLESGQLRRGYIVWREDWNDWLPVEQIFPELAETRKADPAYEIPADLNPHSEISRKRRFRKLFWMSLSAGAFLLVLVLVYCICQFGF